MSKMKNLKDLFIHQLRDLYSAETQLIEAMPKMQKKATNKQLQNALDQHLKETKEQKERLEQVFRKLDMDPEGEKCKAMEGLIKEAEDMLGEDMEDEVRDAAIIADAQRIEHYEISGYGTVCTYAEEVGSNEVKSLLEKTLQEEKSTDEKLTKIAESTVNQRAEA